jgi:hypothetical protein
MTARTAYALKPVERALLAHSQSLAHEREHRRCTSWPTPPVHTLALMSHFIRNLWHTSVNIAGARLGRHHLSTPWHSCHTWHITTSHPPPHSYRSHVPRTPHSWHALLRPISPHSQVRVAWLRLVVVPHTCDLRQTRRGGRGLRRAARLGHGDGTQLERVDAKLHQVRRAARLQHVGGNAHAKGGVALKGTRHLGFVVQCKQIHSTPA